MPLNRYSAVLSLLLCVFYCIPLSAQVQTARYVSMSSKTKAYYEYLPEGYDAAAPQTYPLILFMTGISEFGDGSAAQLPWVLRNGTPKLISNGTFPTSFTVNGATYKFIIITPQWTRNPLPTATDMDSVLDYIVGHYKVDEKRIYITGLSYGGGLTWAYGGGNSMFANRVAAIVPVCGAGTPIYSRSRTIAAADLPVWATHNDKDPSVPDTVTITYVNNINLPPAPVPPAKMTIFQSASHDAWTKTYNPSFRENNLNIYEWMLQYQRNILMAGSNSPVCPGTTLRLRATLVSGATYSWTGPNGFTSSSRTPTVPNATAAMAGTYTVTIKKGDSTAQASTVVQTGTVSTYYRDYDNDGYGGARPTIQACEAPEGYVATTGDCNDSKPAIHPGAQEIKDGLDNNCNGLIDEGTDETKTFYRDEDQDGYGNNSVKVQAATAPAGYVADNTDCDDNNAAVHPGAAEICDGIDNNCDGEVDEGLATKTYYQDNDKDGYGNKAVSIVSCTQPAGYVTDNTDCNDASAGVHPGAAEIPGNRIDDNCDGRVDENDGVVTGIPQTGGSGTTVLAVAYPNPSSGAFLIRLSGTAGKLVSIRIIDGAGRVVEKKSSLPANAVLHMGQNYLPGLYYLEVTQENRRVTVKLEKQGN